MKKIILGSILVAVIAGLAVFFFRPPAVADHTPQTVLALTFRLPEGYELTEGAPFTLAWQVEDLAGELSDAVRVKHFDPVISPYLLGLSPRLGTSAVVLTAHLYYCAQKTRMCFQGEFKARVPLVAGIASPVPYVWEITPENTSGLGTSS